LTSQHSESDELGPTQELDEENKLVECETGSIFFLIFQYHHFSIIFKNRYRTIFLFISIQYILYIFSYIIFIFLLLIDRSNNNFCFIAAEKETIPALETATSYSDNSLVTDSRGENARLELNHKTNQTLSEDWYYYGSNKSKRMRYLFCGDCNFKTHQRSYLVAHVKSQHTSSTTAFPSPRKTLLTKKGRRAQLIEIECAFDHCTYKTKQQFKWKKHETSHRRKSNHNCLICSYSTRTITLLKIHVQRDHPQGKDSDEELLINQVRKMPSKLCYIPFVYCSSCIGWFDYIRATDVGGDERRW